MAPLISDGLTPMAVVFGRHSVFDFLQKHQFAPEEDETMEDAQQRHMRRIPAARLAVIEQDARDVVRVFRLSQVRAHVPYRFAKDEPVQVYYRDIPPRKSVRRGGFRFLAALDHNVIVEKNRWILKFPL